MEDLRMAQVRILLQQGNYTEAERILNDVLATAPNDIEVLYLMAETKLGQDDSTGAMHLIDTAIGLSPDTPYLYYVKARICMFDEESKKAEEWIQLAISLDPADADYFAMRAHIELSRKLFSQALDSANQALELDAENIMALNVRSTALTKLDRKQESAQTIEGALREDPNNTYTHSNYGWNLLEQGDYKKALVHFKEALTQDPTNEYAKAGLLEALKAKNVIYRGFLKYAFWIGNLTSKYQWGVLIGFYIGVRILRAVAEQNEALQPILIPLLVILAIVAFSTWVMEPIANLFLRFNKYGQLLLQKHEKLSSNFVAISCAMCISGLVLYLVLDDIRFLSLAAFGFAMMLPINSAFSPAKNKNVLAYYTIAMALIGIGAVYQTFATGELFNAFSSIFLLGFIGYQWVANFFLIERSNR